MKKQLLKIGMVACAGVLATQLAWAQPDPNDAPKADNPPENNRQPRGGRGGGNPEEMRQRMEQQMRNMLTQVGVKETATQDTVLEYIRTDMETRQPLRQQAMKLFQALRNGGVTDDQLLALVTDYRAAQEADKVRREKAQAELDAKVHYSQNPRLEAVLMLAGVVGDGQGMMFMGGGGGGRGGQGGPGGPNGFGGRQGQGGDQAGGQGNLGGDRNMTPEQREERRKEMVKRYDKNANGQLDEDERATMREEMRQRRQQRQQREGQQPGADGNNAPNNGDNPPPPPAGGEMPDA